MAGPALNPWRETLRLAEIGRGPVERHLEAPESLLAGIARAVGVDALRSLSADVTVKPWLDGAELRGALTAEIVQTCGVTLEPFDETVSGVFEVRVVPAGSPNAATPADEEIGLEDEDPPDELEGETIDLAAYVVEHLALEIDPFPRKPGAVFEAPESEPEASPFAVLKGLKDG